MSVTAPDVDVNPAPYLPPTPLWTQSEPTGRIQLNQRLVEGIYA